MLILFYNTFFDSAPALVDCGSGCTFTTDRRLLRDADAVVFHLPDAPLIGDARKYPGQTWVAWTMESTVNTPLMDRPELMRHFDLRMTFSRASDVWCSYLPSRREVNEALARPVPLRRHENPVVMLQSATVDNCGRNAFCAELIRHVPIDSYGRLLRNRELDVPDRGIETKRALVAGYKFTLGAENTFETDYVTEKLFQPLLMGSVPVYRGAPNVADYAPGDDCFIDATAFATPAQLGEYLRHLDSDDAAYGKYLAWRGKPLRDSFVRMLEAVEMEAFCRLAELVARRGRTSGTGELMPFGPRRYVGAKVARARQVARRVRSALRRRGLLRDPAAARV